MVGLHPKDQLRKFGDNRTCIEVENLSHAYGARQALAGVTFSVSYGELVGFLGPNGGGKTTLFKILSTLIPVTHGMVRLLGYNLVHESHIVRKHLGVVFQHPSLDSKLTVVENLRHHGHLYGLWGKELKRRIHVVLDQLELGDRAGALVETLSGGLQRRVELAKAILHQPDLLLLDEPGTGLDPGVRRNFRACLAHLRDQEGATILMTTHILDEAEGCDRVGILHEGELVAMGTPDELKALVGGDVVMIDSPDPEGLDTKIRQRFGYAPTLIDRSLRVECHRGHEFVRDVVSAFPAEIRSVRFGKPTLEDVFIKLTGHRFREENEQMSK
ncbi:ABC transporter ATP-binding protein [Candidatus Poribacteria bacterium]|nr:ABC transporter ATP-binding protein [Candidatus Poribacteria bacterium]